MSKSRSGETLVKLHTAVDNICAVLLTLQPAIRSPSADTTSTTSPPNPLAVYGDASRLLKAQTTKLSLLLLNQPFTPAEIAYILDSLSNSCLPALARASELCSARRYTKFLGQHLRSSLQRIWAELNTLLHSIPRDTTAVDKLHSGETQAILASTGILWAECDKIVHACEDGLIAVAAETVTARCALLEDAIGEIEEWDPEDESDDSTDIDSEDNAIGTPKASKSTMIITPTTSDEETMENGMQQMALNPMVSLKARILKHLKMIKMVYMALKKRRIISFPNVDGKVEKQQMPTERQVQIFDGIMVHTQRFTEEADEIAGALYAEDTVEVERRLKLLMTTAKQCIGESRTGWDNMEDEFSTWSDSWVRRLEELDT